MVNNPVLSTRLTRLWDIDVPIIGAPMAGRSGGELAAAVSRAGGLGMFGVGGNTTAQWVKDNARIAREGTRPTARAEHDAAHRILRPTESGEKHNEQGSVDAVAEPHGNFGIGVMLWSIKDKPEVWQAVLDARPKVVSLGFGDPTGYAQQAQEYGISVVVPVNDIEQVRQAVAAEVDAICIQGTDAGGHTGHIGTMPLMQQVLDYLMLNAPGIPTAVAGGICSGRGVAAALAAGADAAWIGTALLASPEALGSEELRAAAIKASSKQTLLTDIYDRAEQQAWDTEKWPTRTVANGFTDVYAEMSRNGEVTDEELIVARAPGGDFADDIKLHAGQGIGMLVQQQAAGDVVNKFAAEATRLLRREL
ncbi:NAD(P)H-dependent flavin oxidoreductase [Corynebacterium anserum]|uniref:Nitronate monooxygenase n=1 Tax=Corynebacterium anserum TaxID=2684406 RepID=A0A7G7YLI3_9CORY|nr:nitronate monooxygenase [Corynebacterium anserum]MBC2682583.1 nitronate monooxygenase [Corynebacterium anserum]QNH95353.1 nitronate monooxygenase [Corynebacterium anserum]